MTIPPRKKLRGVLIVHELGQLRHRWAPIEQTKIDGTRKFFAEINKKYVSENVRYDVVNNFGKVMELVK